MRVCVHVSIDRVVLLREMSELVALESAGAAAAASEAPNDNSTAAAAASSHHHHRRRRRHNVGVDAAVGPSIHDSLPPSLVAPQDAAEAAAALGCVGGVGSVSSAAASPLVPLPSSAASSSPTTDMSAAARHCLLDLFAHADAADRNEVRKQGGGQLQPSIHHSIGCRRAHTHAYIDTHTRIHAYIRTRTHTHTHT
eukprot:GHVU01106426.1.p1 GENE.GHVU01106426.1~~GHVU01106426.1.p1  ORF type:complete len:196 (-),score=38.33 GHVU01106426.1:65-652(-)